MLDINFLLEVLENEKPKPKEDHEAYYLALEMLKKESNKKEQTKAIAKILVNTFDLSNDAPTMELYKEKCWDTATKIISQWGIT